MKRGYLFISNSTKPTKEQMESVDPIAPGSFEKSSIYAANELGWEIHMGVNRSHPEYIRSIGFDIKFYNQNSFRNIFAIRDNWKAYKNLCTYLKNNPPIEIIHCNTPIGGLIGRLAGAKYNKKVVYMAHGFHFYEGAPLFNKTILKWIESWLAHKTDVLITINEEDYQNAKKLKLKDGGNVYKVSGVGIDVKAFENTTYNLELKKSLGLKETDFVCISLGDLNKNKNYSTVIDAIAKVNLKDVHYLICGIGPLEKELKRQVVKLGLESQIHLLGYRTDVKELMAISDCAIISSFREGLPRTTMEAMACSLPCVVSDIRGNRDLIENVKGGFLVSPTESQQYADAIITLKDNPTLCKHMSEWNLRKIKDFDIRTVRKQMYNIFKNL